MRLPLFFYICLALIFVNLLLNLLLDREKIRQVNRICSVLLCACLLIGSWYDITYIRAEWNIVRVIFCLMIVDAAAVLVQSWVAYLRNRKDPEIQRKTISNAAVLVIFLLLLAVAGLILC